MIDYVKSFTIYGDTVEIIKGFIKDTLEIAEIETTGSIVIYENNQGYWNVSK